MSQSLNDFLKSRIIDDIKKKKKDIPKIKDLKKEGYSEEESEKIINVKLQELEQKCEEKYSSRNWFLTLYKNLHKLFPSTHIGKFSHPDVKISLQNQNFQNTIGYLCNGNFRTILQDYIVNAAYLPYVKTLESCMPDGKTVREHLQTSSDTLKEFIQFDKKEYEDLQDAYRSMMEQSKHSDKTNHRLKQVYFPLGNDQYRVFTLLPCSTLIWELKTRVRSREWNQEKKQRIAYIDHVNRKYGGTKPQNISYLNNEKGGNSILLSSFPPILKRDYKLPATNFFSLIRIYRPKYFSPQKSPIVLLFDTLHDNLVHDPNSQWARRKKVGIIRSIMERAVILPAETIRRNAPPGWSLKDTYSKLPVFQKAWLDPYRPKDILDTSSVPENWQDHIARQISGFITSTFRRLMKTSAIKQKIVIDDPFSDEIASIAMEYLHE